MGARGVIMIQIGEDCDDRESRRDRARIVNSYASAEVRRLPDFRDGRNGGAIVVEVDPEEFRASPSRKVHRMWTINADGTDFGDDIELGPTVAEQKLEARAAAKLRQDGASLFGEAEQRAKEAGL